MTDASVTCSVRIGSNDKLHRALPLTKTSFPRTSAYRYIPTAGYLILLHYSAELFCVCPAELYFRCGSGSHSQTPPRKQPGDDRRLVILPRRRRLSNQSAKFHRRGCFLFIAVERAKGKKERNRGFGKGGRDVYANSAQKDWKPGGKRVEREKIGKERNGLAIGKRRPGPAVVVDRSPSSTPGVVCRVNRCSTTQQGVLLQPA